MFTVFILFILKYFFNCNLLSCGSIHSKINNTKSPLTCHTFNFIPTRWWFRPLGLDIVGVGFKRLINLSFQVFIRGERFIFCNSDKSFGLVGAFEHIFGIDVDIFGFRDDPLYFFKLFL